MAKKSNKKILTVPKFMKDLTTNKYVLYLVAFVALINLLGYMAMGKNICVLLFILIAVITSYFSKNMIFVLAVPTFLVGFFAVCDAVKSVKEGLHNDDHDDEEEGNTTKKKKEEDEDEEEEDGKEKLTVMEEEEVEVKPSEDTKKTENYRNSGKKGDRIDYASTLEDAYSNLNNMIGKDGIKNLTKDTKALMDQQMQLATAMKGMQPLIGQAKEMMNSLGELGDMESLTKGLNFAKK
tara:strand:- start:1674 stop:2384 length:711 start_codon:yes stop_codon:yes gene_type:complete